MTLDEAKRTYVHRYTMEHIPEWAKKLCKGTGKYYAPQYWTDFEWYYNTIFPPNSPISDTDCYSSNQSWPLGHWLDAPFSLNQ